MISEDDVRYVAKLARLRIEPDEAARMTGELTRILGHIGKMSELEPKRKKLREYSDLTRAAALEAEEAATQLAKKNEEGKLIYIRMLLAQQWAKGRQNRAKLEAGATPTPPLCRCQSI